MNNKVNFYLDDNTGEILAICEKCFKTTKIQDVSYIDKAGEWDICLVCDAQNVPAWYHEKPEFPYGEFDNGGHWQGEL